MGWIMNIFDIAKKSGVSITTVSRVLNDTGLVKEETREKILRVMRENDYTPNSLARGLAKKESMAIGLVIPNINNPFYSEMVRAVQDMASQKNYSVVAVNTDDSIETEKRILSTLMARQMDGMIFAGGRYLAQKHNIHLRELAKKIPTVLAYEDIDDPNIFCVNARKEQATYLITSHLIRLGHKRIFFVNTQDGFKPSREKLSGYQKAMREWGLEMGDAYVISGSNSIQAGFEAGKRIAADLRGATAVLTASDIIAMGAMNALVLEGLHIPDDVSVAGFDNINLSEFFNPPLTTVSIDLYEMAKTAALVLDHLINGTYDDHRVVMLEPKLVIRNSCAAPNGLKEDGISVSSHL